ncbi:hypothetical protein AB4169_03505 [Vibrio lentus]|uniref:hypothetical protein n=1 Tax=Vibrio TaxID=662 RepID=UPI000C83BF04|nr:MULTISPECIES: hypothetical protein [Vibrio]PME57246.1 hypothetical protein BCV33_10850 [Vibrio lentus]PMG60806.1 hypothetical protein BCU87_15340 [Vibrio lentus]PMM99118.1 hypothetical protein BCT40_05935 [Vibrio lentus]PTP11622.1 hypothetical protein CWO27_22690 [Vibrio sp. 10N.286.51.C3]TKE71726.1 hypothetical protein FCV45_07640 [Vibrio sp. F12]
MFKFSSEVEKVKTQVLILSGIALFISMTGALPGKIEIIGLNLEGNKTVAGWFLLAILTFISIKFVVLSSLEVIKKLLPTWIDYKGKNIRGDTLGMTQAEINAEHDKRDDEYDEDAGTLSGEFHEIHYKRSLIDKSYRSRFVTVHNVWVYSSDFIFPILFVVYSGVALYTFLSTSVVHTFT